MNRSQAPAAIPNRSTPILDIVQKQLLPWLNEHGVQRLVVAQPQARDLALPRGVGLTRRKRRGPRVGARGQRRYGNAGLIAAHWPEDNQIELQVPQLMYVVSGQADVHFGDYLLHCPTSYAVFIPPGVSKPIGSQPHLEGANRAHGACDLLWFGARGQRLQIWICHSRSEEHISPEFNEVLFTLDDKLVRLLDDLKEELTADRDGSSEIAASLLRTFLLTLRRDLREDRFLYPSSTLHEELPPVKVYDPIGHARSYIKNHLYDTLTIEKVARHIRMSRAQFARRFKQETGQTFTEFTTRCRLEQAQVLLRETDFNIPYICRFVGYKSIEHFKALFLREFGLSPLEFRRRQPDATE